MIEEANQAKQSNSGHIATSVSDDDASTDIADGSTAKVKEGVETEPRQSKHFSSYGKAGDPEKDAKRAAEYEARRAKRLEKDEKKDYKKVPGDILWPAFGGL
ncbi:hypothetical protein FOB58_005422 [Candida parapsilosis]|nr:hypothetical protein FOB58_005422 [Candida parapsilosis]KAF6043796.1 hypothetical protein FOB59_004752 [Candida parapsilosis]KAF6060371.1 hypothetical protein FOB61_005386 [Candida parapsilosis]